MSSRVGKIIRLSRIINPLDGKAIIVAADHGFMLGPVKGVIDLEKTVKNVVEGGADGILLSPGQAARLGHLLRGRKSPALLIRVDWTNAGRTGLEGKKGAYIPPRKLIRTAVATAKDALALGASAIIVYLFIGYGDDEDEARNFRSISMLARECSRVGLPIIVEAIPVGERVSSANLTDLVRISVRMAVEVGADAIKVPYTGDIESFKEIVNIAGVPLLILGGAKAKTERDALEVAAEALEAGSAGVVFGRQIIQASDPIKTLLALRALIHENRSLKEILEVAPGKAVRLQVDPSKCTGCRLCELACSLRHEGHFNPYRARIRVKYKLNEEFRQIACEPYVCTLCGNCVQACPEEALAFSPEGYLQLLTDKCSVCGECVRVCPVEIITLDTKADMPLICDMCQGAPKCVEWCSYGAIWIA